MSASRNICVFFYLMHTITLACIVQCKDTYVQENINSFCFSLPLLTQTHTFGIIWARYEPALSTNQVGNKFEAAKKFYSTALIDLLDSLDSYVLVLSVCLMWRVYWYNKCPKFSNKDNCFAVQLDIFLIKSLK